jgi:hypothetical protein
MNFSTIRYSCCRNFWNGLSCCFAMTMVCNRKSCWTDPMMAGNSNSNVVMMTTMTNDYNLVIVSCSIFSSLFSNAMWRTMNGMTKTNFD